MIKPIAMRRVKDIVAGQLLFFLCMVFLLLAFVICFGLYHKARPILAVKPLSDLLFSYAWHPMQGQFGLAGFIMGTIWVTAIALLIAVPLSVFTAMYLSEYAPQFIRNCIKPCLDVLTGISPVIFGVWGMLVIVPFVRDCLAPFFTRVFPFFPFISDNETGFSALAAGIVLAMMISPIIITICDDLLRAVPREMREASFAVGATHWETIKHVVLRKSWPGIIAAILLGLARAFGETMAVLMVAGCALQQVPKSIFDTAYPLPAFIANTYGEMMSIPLYDAAVFLAALFLLVVTALCNIAGWGILLHMERKAL